MKPIINTQNLIQFGRITVKPDSNMEVLTTTRIRLPVLDLPRGVFDDLLLNGECPELLLRRSAEQLRLRQEHQNLELPVFPRLRQVNRRIGL